MRMVGTVVAVVLGCTLFAGCSQEPDATPVKETPKLSQEQFLERGNEICRKGNVGLERAGEKVDASTPAQARRTVQKVIVPNIREQVAELNGLRGPAKLERRLDPVLEETGRILDFLHEDPTRYGDADLLFASVDKDLAALGLDACGASG